MKSNRGHTRHSKLRAAIFQQLSLEKTRLPVQVVCMSKTLRVSSDCSSWVGTSSSDFRALLSSRWSSQRVFGVFRRPERCTFGSMRTSSTKQTSLGWLSTCWRSVSLREIKLHNGKTRLWVSSEPSTNSRARSSGCKSTKSKTQICHAWRWYQEKIIACKIKKIQLLITQQKDNS